MLSVLLAGAALAGCGSSSAGSTISIPPTTPTTLPSAANIPAFGTTPSVLPATAANARANAQGACSRFSVLFVRLAQLTVPASEAQQKLAPVQLFAAAAATGSPTQWSQLASDVNALMNVVNGPSWVTPSQAIIPQVASVNQDCQSA